MKARPRHYVKSTPSLQLDIDPGGFYAMQDIGIFSPSRERVMIQESVAAQFEELQSAIRAGSLAGVVLLPF